jgi:antitoxin component YwqK of YwqJK toxin-antitoxin module
MRQPTQSERIQIFLGTVVSLALVACAVTPKLTSQSDGDVEHALNSWKPHELPCPAGSEPRGLLPPFGTEVFCREISGDQRKQGPGIEYYTSGKRYRSGFYVDGERDGLWLGWQETGELLERIHYRAGKKSGLWTLFGRDGQKRIEGNYVEDALDGVGYEWHPNGRLYKEITYVKGTKQGRARMWYPSGRLQAEAVFSNDQRQGLEILYYENGRKQREIPYESGRIDGVVTTWTETGELQSRLDAALLTQ